MAEGETFTVTGKPDGSKAEGRGIVDEAVTERTPLATEAGVFPLHQGTCFARDQGKCSVAKGSDDWGTGVPRVE